MAVSTPGIHAIPEGPSSGFIDSLNTRWHKVALRSFMVIVLLHWAEHVVQAYQFYVLHMPRPMSMGLMGMVYPWLMKTETLHKIEEALSRLEEGTYGNCFECGDEISERRLRALPFAVRCKDCEEAREIAEQRERTTRRGSGFLIDLS